MKTEELVIIKKAWSVDLDQIERDWEYGNGVAYGTIGQAKAKLIGRFEGAIIALTDEEVTFLNLPIKRNKECDYVLYDRSMVKRYCIEELKKEDRISNLSDDETYYVQDRRNYVGNAVLWWGLNSSGYTTDLKRAQKYTGAELKQGSWRDTDIIWESEHVETAVREYVDMQYLDKENSI